VVVAAVVVVAAPNPDEADPDPGADPNVGGGETRDSGAGIVTGAALGAALELGLVVGVGRWRNGWVAGRLARVDFPFRARTGAGGARLLVATASGSYDRPIR
jgi:hypothetical protein